MEKEAGEFGRGESLKRHDGWRSGQINEPMSHCSTSLPGCLLMKRVRAVMKKIRGSKDDCAIRSVVD